MKKFLAAASVAGLLAGAAHAADTATPHVFKPSGAWQGDYGEDYCRLARPFSDGKDTLSIALERVQPVNMVRLMVVGNGVKVFRSANQMEYTLSPSGGDRKAQFWRSETAEGQQFLSLGDVMLAAPLQLGTGGPGGPGGPPPPGAQPPEPGKPMAIPPYNRAAELDFAKGVNAVEITAGVTEPVRIETGSLKAPVEVLQACTDDLLKYWGLDPEKHKTMTRPVQPSTPANEWLPTGTIGFEDFSKLGDSANQLRILVSAEGKPTACAVIRPSLDKKTNDAMCKAVMDKGQFFPALDAQGQAMASYWVVAPFFLMPPFRT